VVAGRPLSGLQSLARELLAYPFQVGMRLKDPGEVGAASLVSIPANGLVL